MTKNCEHTPLMQQYHDIKIDYPDTLRWYICSHVPYIKTIKHIKEVMVTLQDQSLTLENIHYNKQLLQCL